LKAIEGAMYMIHSNVIEIGTEAISENDPIMILFDKTATPALRNYSVIQEFQESPTFSLDEGDTITFDNQEYRIEHVGRTANQNLEAVGHVTLIFDEYNREDAIVNGIYLSPYQVPEIHLGTHIRYD
jgi:PTS system glucitol/sorbitol-specific IIA component